MRTEVSQAKWCCLPRRSNIPKICNPVRAVPRFYYRNLGWYNLLIFWSISNEIPYELKLRSLLNKRSHFVWKLFSFDNTSLLLTIKKTLEILSLFFRCLFNTYYYVGFLYILRGNKYTHDIQTLSLFIVHGPQSQTLRRPASEHIWNHRSIFGV